MSFREVKEAYVWIWLPDQTEPVVAGRLEAEGDQITFNYGKSYLARVSQTPPAISIYEPELPLKEGILPLPKGLQMPGCIRDAAPDAWGRRVILSRKLGHKGIDTSDLSELTYLLESGSDRIGALDFQRSPSEYQPRGGESATLEELHASIERVEKGIPLADDVDNALFHGSSIGGARPKALIQHNKNKFIAKFSLQSDLFNIVKGEYIAMRLAALAGLNVAPVKLIQVAKKDVLLIERFDRIATGSGWTRKAMVSALTLLGLDEMMARYASYEDFAEIIRQRFTNPRATLKELLSRLIFSILSGNTDDHARNHAAFWDGKNLVLTPAYDICPQNRAGNEVSQAMKIIGDQNLSQLKFCLQAAHNFLLSKHEVQQIIDHQIETINAHWDHVCEEAKLSKVDRKFFWGRQFLNSFSMEK